MYGIYDTGCTRYTGYTGHTEVIYGIYGVYRIYGIYGIYQIPQIYGIYGIHKIYRIHRIHTFCIIICIILLRRCPRSGVTHLRTYKAVSERLGASRVIYIRSDLCVHPDLRSGPAKASPLARGDFEARPASGIVKPRLSLTAHALLESVMIMLMAVKAHTNCIASAAKSNSSTSSS